MNWAELIPPAFAVVKEIANRVSPKASAVAGFAENIVTFIIDAETNKLSPEFVIEKIDEMVLELKADIKYGA